jgi:Stage II sporulation protein E (SpoIIE)/GAF domain
VATTRAGSDSVSGALGEKDLYAGLIEELRARWAPILDTLGEGITIQTVDGKVVYANQAVADQLGLSVDEIVSAGPGAVAGRFDIRDEHGQPISGDQMPGRVILREGVDQAELLVRNTVVETGELRWFLMKARRLEGHDQELALNLVEDLTAVKKAGLAQRVLADSGRILASSLDFEKTLREVARLAVPELADWCGVDMPGPHGEIYPVAIAHIDPEKLRIGEELRERYPVDPEGEAGLPAVIRGGPSFLAPRIRDEELVAYAEDEHHLELLRAVGFSAVMIVPMAAQGRTVGALTFVSAESGRTFDEDDLGLAEELGRRAGMAVANSRAYSERAHIARTLQESLRPPDLPEIEGWDIAALHEPAGEANEVGGDFFEVFAVPDGWMAIIGDVEGKGAAAASVTGVARHTIHAVGQLTSDPFIAVRQLDDRLRGGPENDLCSVAVAHVVGATAEIVSAGHPPPVYVGGREVRQLELTGPLPGALPDPGEWPAERVELQPGEALVLFTDGVTDAGGAEGERFGTARLIAALESPAQSAQEIVDRVRNALVGFGVGPQRDDIACLVLRRR